MQNFTETIKLTDKKKLRNVTNIQDIQDEEIRISVNLPYVEGTSEKLQHILRSHKIRSTFYTEMTFYTTM